MLNPSVVRTRLGGRARKRISGQTVCLHHRLWLGCGGRPGREGNLGACHSILRMSSAVQAPLVTHAYRSSLRNRAMLVAHGAAWASSSKLQPVSHGAGPPWWRRPRLCRWGRVESSSLAATSMQLAPSTWNSRRPIWGAAEGGSVSSLQHCGALSRLRGGAAPPAARRRVAAPWARLPTPASHP